jgi:predicted aspartyl protease
MGTFRASIAVQNHADPRKRADVASVLVDTGSELTWIPASTLETIGVKRVKKDMAFVTATGKTVTRSVGYAIIQCRAGRETAETIDEVVFGEPGDLALLGARSLEGLNLTVDSRRKQLVAAGPVPAA